MDLPYRKGKRLFQNNFSEYQEDLKYLFEVYTDKESETLFILLSKLYTGIEILEKRTAAEKSKKEDQADENSSHL